MDRKIIEQMGFKGIKLGAPYQPLLLNCTAVGEPYRIVGTYLDDYKYFKDGQDYVLYCMYGRDYSGQYRLFCKEESDKVAYKMLRGYFYFTFDGKQFFELLKTSSRKNWNNFVKYCRIRDIAEIDIFNNLVTEAGDELTPKQKKRAELLVLKLRDLAYFL